MRIISILILLLATGCCPLLPRGYSDTIHIVRPGDTLEIISVQYYGSELQMRLIMEANYLKAKGKLKSGQKIRIPSHRGKR